MSFGPKASVSVRVLLAICDTYGPRAWAARRMAALLLAEAVEAYHLGAARRLVRIVGFLGRFGRGRGGRRRGRLRRDRRGGGQLLLGRRLGAILAAIPGGFLRGIASGRLPVGLSDLLELQAELYRRVEEALDRLEGHMELLRHAAEGQADREAVLVNLEIPEHIQEDAGLFFW